MSGRLSAVVVEDEPLARERLEGLLAERDDVDLGGSASSVAEARDLLSRVRPDLLFLDVELPDGDGFEVLGLLDPEESPLVLFVTAYEQHAVEAFEVEAFDYLLKPYARERFHRAVARAVERSRSRSAEMLAERLAGLRELLQGPEEKIERFVVRKRDHYVVVSVADIEWVGAARNYAELHASGGRHLVRFTMDVLEDRLDARRFVRVHRSVIVNVSRVAELHPLPGGDFTLVLRSGAEVRMSRSYRAALERFGCGTG